MHTIAEIIRDLLIFVGAMAVLLVGLIVVVSRLSGDNPLRQLLVALCYRVGATMAAGLVAIPVEPVPGLDAVYDLAVPVALAIYWLSFLRRLMAGTRSRRLSP